MEIPVSSPPDAAGAVLAGLDADQHAAVTAAPGIVIVRAGAGSGKTTVLTRRIAWRAHSETGPAERTLAITFTRQAATEMRTRLAGLGLDSQPTVSTFHALGLRLLTRHAEDNRRPRPVVVNNRLALLRKVLGGTGAQDHAAVIADALDLAAVRMATGPGLAASLAAAGTTRILTPEEFAAVRERYEAEKRARRVVDTNDLIGLVVAAAEQDPRFRWSVRHQFRHVCVDEAQDMNPLQYEMLRLIVGEEPDLFVVGDPHQAIYGFNGADRTLFEDLPGMTGGATVLTLPRNYRCSPEVVEAATRLLRTGGEEIEAVSCRPPGRPVAFRPCDDDDAEAATVAEEIVRMRNACGTWDLLAVLVRVNALAETLAAALERRGIPVRSSRRGPDWSAAVAQATSLTSRSSLAAWSSDVLDLGGAEPGEAIRDIAELLRRYLDENRVGTVDGRSFSAWLAWATDERDVHGVEVMTFHAAKGRQWWGVVIAGAETGMLPHSSARSAEARSEEARLGYVAFTRAAEQLVVTWAARRGKQKRTRSPLLPVSATRVLTPQGPPAEVRETAARARGVDPVVEALRGWRARTALRSRLEPAGILDDARIAEIARLRPATSEGIAAITDPLFAARHSAAILAVIDSAGTGPA